MTTTTMSSLYMSPAAIAAAAAAASPTPPPEVRRFASPGAYAPFLGRKARVMSPTERGQLMAKAMQANATASQSSSSAAAAAAASDKTAVVASTSGLATLFRRLPMEDHHVVEILLEQLHPQDWSKFMPGKTGHNIVQLVRDYCGSSDMEVVLPTDVNDVVSPKRKRCVLAPQDPSSSSSSTSSTSFASTSSATGSASTGSSSARIAAAGSQSMAARIVSAAAAAAMGSTASSTIPLRTTAAASASVRRPYVASTLPQKSLTLKSGFEIDVVDE